jgi:hypothetical protein
LPRQRSHATDGAGRRFASIQNDRPRGLMHKFISLIGVMIAVLMVYVLTESVLESALRRRSIAGTNEDASAGAVPPALSTRHKRLLFGLLVAVAGALVAAFWKKL